MSMPDFEAWAAFAKVAAVGSFAKAAQELAISNATASKLVARLEARIGERLFHRNSRRLSLTTTGLRLAERADKILASAENIEVEAIANATSPRGLIRMTAPMSFGLNQVAPLLADFMRAYPEISVDLNLDDRVTDIIGAGVDVAIRITTMRDSQLKVRRLCTVRRFAVGAPSYFRKRGKPTRPKDLINHSCLLYSYLSSGQIWHFVNAGRRKESVKVSGPLTVNNADALTDALEAGLGVALQPDFIAWKGLNSGALVNALPDWSAPPLYVALVMPHGGPRAARVGALVDFFSERFARTTSPWADL